MQRTQGAIVKCETRRWCLEPSLAPYVLGFRATKRHRKPPHNWKDRRNTQLKRWTFVRVNGTDVSPLSGCLHHLFDNVLLNAVLWNHVLNFGASVHELRNGAHQQSVRPHAPRDVLLERFPESPQQQGGPEAATICSTLPSGMPPMICFSRIAFTTATICS